ncbi:FIG00553257: hypothetical protein [Cronobacter condimenti 1330]|uniref:Uncharacterized protein n=1 Tax=Cronobacter condimenti 1330 TaxID=1073999 RepID=K8AJT9_9ENTR|nr:hypothetical protein [Cronobacter condimenti]ALB64553.1 hypothetical protein AFK62_19445 [Cronobacter condimenti 1330]CCJ74527.1 FIG00553257: hypothetical protein [Cronobacter condimenti 1330]
MATMHFAVWYSTASNAQALREALPAPDCGRHFLQDFGFAPGSAEDAIALWYGAAPGEMGSIYPHNPALDPQCAFLTRAAAELLCERGVSEISFLYALPDVDYYGERESSPLLVFLGNILCCPPPGFQLPR